MPLSEEQIKRIAEEAAKKAQPFFRDSDYHRTFEVRSVISEKPEEASEMIIEGRATVFNQTTELLSYHDPWDNVDVILEEEIAPEAVEHSDSRKCFLKFNHSDDVFPVARCKEGRVGPGTMALIPQADGLYFRASLSDTQAGRDLNQLVKDEVLTEMSFAFDIGAKEVTQTEEKREGQCDLIRIHRRVTRIDHLYDVAAVCYPAYDNTSLYARSRADAEALIKEAMEVARQKRMAKLREIGAKALRGEPTDQE